MKKLLSIVLTVAMLCAFTVSASAASNVNLMVKTVDGAEKACIATNDENHSTVTIAEDGTAEAVVKTAWGGTSNDVAYGMSVEPLLTNINLNDTPYVHMVLSSTVPFRITMLDNKDANNLKWIGFGGEFFNSVYPTGGTAPSTAPENGFFPAGDYDCYAFLKGYYDWKTNNDGLAGFDPSSVNVTGFYIEAKEAGTVKLSKLELTASNEPSEGGDATTKADTGATTTAAKTTAKAGTDSAKTADVSNSLLFIAVAVLAGGVVTVTAVSAKQKAR